MLFNVSELHYMAIIAGGFLYMIYGTIYYSLLLGKNKEGGQSEGPLKYIISVIVAFISSFFVALLVQVSSAEGLIEGAAVGMIIGILITIVYLKNTLFGLVTKKAFLIAIGDHLIIFTLLGALQGLLQ